MEIIIWLYWLTLLHKQIPKEPTVKEERLNLTFRVMHAVEGTADSETPQLPTEITTPLTSSPTKLVTTESTGATTITPQVEVITITWKSNLKSDHPLPSVHRIQSVLIIFTLVLFRIFSYCFGILRHTLCYSLMYWVMTEFKFSFSLFCTLEVSMLMSQYQYSLLRC